MAQVKEDYMKRITYQIQVGQEADVVLVSKAILCTGDTLEANLTAAKAEAYNGEVTVEDVPDDRPLDEIKAHKIADLSVACNAAIVAGMDVETTQGTEHFSLEETDQINLTTALTAVQAGASDYPYHADGQLCRMFTAAEIQTIAQASVQHKLYHTTLCNHLLTWARRAETAEELAGISYTADNLPDDLAANMAAVLAVASSL